MTQQNDKKVGAALVLGGGIAGMQASLDLANAGYKVYLVDRSPTIGGTMSQLDKTFPTNDCSMCIVSPKLVEVARHIDIETITNSELDVPYRGSGKFSGRSQRLSPLYRFREVYRLRHLPPDLPGEGG